VKAIRAAQTEQIFRNLRSVVEAAGGTLDDIVKITIFVTDASYRPAVAAARQRHFREDAYPASTYLVVTASRACPRLLVEIEAVAIV
jgi:enamine deaminase RidA (YjgF/YER057c/UK114 family)